MLHNLFTPAKFTRTITLNTQYLFLFKNTRDKSNISFLARQFAPNNSQYLIDSYLHATAKPFGYLLLDFTQKCDDLIRVRACILDNITIVYCQ